MKQKTDEFVVFTDSGKRYLVYEYTNFIDAGSFANPKAYLHGLKEYRTVDGMTVTFVEEGTYKIVPLDIIARKIYT